MNKLAIFLITAALCQAAEQLIVLRDGELEATIAPAQGGELCSLKFRHGGVWRELLYRACEYGPAEGWRGKAPLLWPATGGTLGAEQGSYTAAGKKYQMPFHGFAQTMPWDVESKSQSTATLKISDTAATRVHYPFGFEVSVTYSVQDGRFRAAYSVRASKQNTQKMFFSIGNHITFRVPFVDGSAPGDVLFEAPAGALMLKDAKNFPTGKTAAPPFPGVVKLADVTALKAISLAEFKGDPYIALKDPQGLRVYMSHSSAKLPKQPFVQFNIWGDPKAGYFSPEPWVGAQNSLNLRMGLVEVAPGEAWQWRIDIRPEHAK